MHMLTPHLDIAKNIRCLVSDVDGVMTDGRLYYDAQGENTKVFNVQDGMGLTLLMKANIDVAVISGRSCEALKVRLQELSIQHMALGQGHKAQAFDTLLSTLKIDAKQVAYIGDDVNDLCILNRAGLAITVANAPAIIKQHAHCVTTRRGGDGALREVCDSLLEAQGHWDNILQSLA